MNKVISGYFDDAHRGLQRQQSERVLPNSNNIQLPPLRPESGPAAPGADRESSLAEKAAMASMQQSYSMGSLEFSREQVDRGIQAERYQQVLQENMRLGRRVRAMQDQLAITSAKKEAFKAQAQRLEREFKKGREQSDTLQRELLDAKREAGQLSKDAAEAMQMMAEMRKAHIHEVRLLQRGLAMRGSDEKMRNRVNEVADLVDKLGRAVVQRDEAIRDRTKTQGKLTKAEGDLKALTDEITRLKRQNRQLQESLKEAQRRAKFVPPRPETDAPEDSDEEFEHELAAFEQRFEILEEGPAGLDILASNLSKDKLNLEKRLKAQGETVRSLNTTVDSLKKLCEEKDLQIEDLNAKLHKLLTDQASLQEQIAQKRREIELQVESEMQAMQKRISELERECDNARAVADGMEKASTRLARELSSLTGGDPSSPK